MSESIIKNKYLNLEGLQKYDELIKKLIAAGDSNLSAAIAALDAKIGSLDIDGSDDKNIANSIADIYTSLADIVDVQNALEAKDSELESKISEEIGKIVGDLESLEGENVVMTLVEVSNKLKVIENSVSKNADDIIAVTNRVSALEATIEDLGAIEGGENLATIVNKVNANAVAIETLMGEGEGSLKEVAGIAAAASQSAANAESVAGEAKTAAEGAVAAAQTAAADAASAQENASAAADSAAAAEGSAASAQANATAAAAAAGQAQTDASDAKSAAEGAVAVAGEAKTAAQTAAADAVKAKDDAASAVAVADEAKAAVDILVGEGEGSVKKIAEDAAAEAVAAVVAGAESDFDTLKEVADWIASDKEGSAALQVSVSNNTESINTINTNIATLEEKVDVDIANLSTHMTDAAAALVEVDNRLDALEAFEETHESIAIEDIEGMFV